MSRRGDISAFEPNSLNFLFVRLHYEEKFYNSFEGCVGLKILLLVLGGGRIRSSQ